MLAASPASKRWRARAAISSICRASPRKLCPASVSRTERVLRSNRVVPSSRSKLRICWLTAGWVTCSVRVGGVDVRDYDMEALREQVAVVLQKNTLFSGTILDNLRWGDAAATREDCIAACRAAAADEFIARLPDGYDTWIERGGANISGGQKQRLCIARALLKKPKVLILDDSTSAVDTATDSRIRRAFAEHIPGTTKLIIAQRISSVQEADRILVLDEGRISGFDSHDRLLETNTIYQEIYAAQTQGGGDFDEGKEDA